MSIPDIILKEFQELNDEQAEAVKTTEGPLLVIAGPGSGKTYVLILRTVNILVQGLAKPSQIVLCTFTEKAAFELRDRLFQLIKKIGYDEDLSEMLIGTIHGISNEFLLRFRHHTPLGNNYEVLDELTQLLFLFDHFNEIIGPKEDEKYLKRWSTKWTAIKGARDYFNKITEELIDPVLLAGAEDPFVQAVGTAYQAYQSKLFETNHIDFAHQQKLFLNLLQDPNIGPSIKEHIRYIMVDEYQDTNYIQEQLLLQLAENSQNICVVGDEDQALYRFRGSTVRNILEFPHHFNNCKTVTLSINYRSHPEIIRGYNKFMNSWDWSNTSKGYSFRFNKEIAPDPKSSFADYPALFAVWGENKNDEASRVADLVTFLKEHQVIEDESQVALLLHSVRLEHSGAYLQAFSEKGIPVFCPRARGYFENEEVRLIIACFSLLLGYYGEGRGHISGQSLKKLAEYIDSSIVELGKTISYPHPLSAYLQRAIKEIAELKSGETLDRRLSDYFYQLISYEPFSAFLKNENNARNLATFSQLLNIFQNYYHYTVITTRNREMLRFHFFNSFLRLLYDGGINEYEDPDLPFPKGHLQVMTIHQAKGLEFPVVIVGSLSAQLSSPKDVDRTLAPFYHRPPFEPETRITGFDRMRLHYVAFSRAEKVLVLTASEQPKSYFNPIWQGLAQWPYIEQKNLKSLSFRLRKRAVLKKAYSFTSDLKVYETCPRQYQHFRYYQFIPSRSAEIFFGALVHQTIEDIHRHVLDGNFVFKNEDKVRDIFEYNFRHLLNRGIRPIGKKQKEEAFTQVLNYLRQNEESIYRVVETEVDVSLEKEHYILTGKIDLLLGSDEKLELLDFKSQPRPGKDDARLDAYYKQLCVYAHILENRYKKKPSRLLLYWTGEPEKKNALMVFPYKPDVVAEAGKYFDRIVNQILARDFAIKKMPERKVCSECDLISYCSREGIIRLKKDKAMIG